MRAAFADEMKGAGGTGCGVPPELPAGPPACGLRRGSVPDVPASAWNHGAVAEPALILWDIDATLLTVRPLGREIHAVAFAEVVGRPLRERAELVRRAVTRAGAAYGRVFAPARVVVIGDTPYDVQGARDAGARSVAVATGGTTVAELAAAGADVVLPDLTDVAALARAAFGAVGADSSPV